MTMRKRCYLAALLVIVGMMGGASPSQAASYKFIVLEPPGLSGGSAEAINDAGQVFIGSYELQTFQCIPVLWKNGTFSRLNYRDYCSEEVVASAMSPWGLVVGTIDDNEDGRSPPRGFTFSTIRNTIYRFYSDSGYTSTIPSSINARGQIAGSTFSVIIHGWIGCPCYSFVYGDSRFELLHPPGVTEVPGALINDAGEIAGEALTAYPGPETTAATSYCFFYKDKRYTNLSAPGWVTCRPTSINARGEVAGNITLRFGTSIGFTLSHGQYKYVRYPGASATHVTRLNGRGELIGNYDDAHAFRLFAGKYTNADVPGSHETTVNGLNESGSYIGTFRGADDIGHAFIAVCDPPGSRCWE